MLSPDGFSWIDKPHLAAHAQPGSLEEYRWLREHGVHLVICLSENPPRRDWVNDAGLFSMHIPIEDMHAPSPSQIDLCIASIDKANKNDFGVSIHCGAGLGRTGTIIACWLVQQDGMTAPEAIARIRRLRPGSVETPEQAEAVAEFARRRKPEGEANH